MAMLPRSSPTHPTSGAPSASTTSTPARYIEYAKRTLSREVSLEGLRVVVDCAQWRGL
jgi:hypothetical protein